MPTIETAFVDPAAIFGKLAPKGPAIQGFDPSPDIAVNLGPSAPHVDEEVELLGELSPGSPPLVGGGPSGHYTNVLDQLWPQFDAPEERTAARLGVLLEETIRVAGQVHTISVDFFERVSFSKISLADRTRFRKEFIDYLRRLKEYQARIDSLRPESTDTATVYVGLVQQRQGAGPVPDAIMHLYFANQLDVLADHVETMSEGFVARVIAGLEAIRDTFIEIDDAAEKKVDDATKAINTWKWVIVGSLTAMATAVIGGLVLAFRPRRPEAKEPT
ncbi:hypothetical protein ACNOYE_34760 [Nannocystaceae bacterium ST9]